MSYIHRSRMFALCMSIYVLTNLSLPPGSASTHTARPSCPRHCVPPRGASEHLPMVTSQESDMKLFRDGILASLSRMEEKMAWGLAESFKNVNDSYVLKLDQAVELLSSLIAGQRRLPSRRQRPVLPEAPFVLSTFGGGRAVFVDGGGVVAVRPRGGVRLRAVWPALTGDYCSVSLEIRDQPGHFVRLRQQLLTVEGIARTEHMDQFRADASFIVTPEAWFRDTIALQPASRPGFYVRRRLNYLEVATFTEESKIDFSFKVRP